MTDEDRALLAQAIEASSALTVGFTVLIIAVVLAAGACVAYWAQIRLRVNVLLLVGAGYAALLIIFLRMSSSGITGDDAYAIIDGPLMALIGGSLAIAKDLLSYESKDSVDNDDGNDRGKTLADPDKGKTPADPDKDTAGH